MRPCKLVRAYPLSAVAVGIVILLTSCSSKPGPPQKGTPAFFWQAAIETSAAGEFVKTSEHLAKLLKTDNEFTTKAQIWKLVVDSGLSKGYMEYADAFELGARNNKANLAPLRKQASDLRTMANAVALETAEGFAKFKEKNKDAELIFAFPFPNVSPAPVPQIPKAGRGLIMPSDEIELGMKSVLKRAVLMATCAAVGAKEDVARTQNLFKAGEVKVPRAVFIEFMAKTLYDQAQLYSEMKLNNPDRMKIFLTQAQEAIKSIPETKDTKELAKKIDEELKRLQKKR